MIYVDPMQPCRPNAQWRWTENCHLLCDPGEEDALHAFAARIGLKREWFQEKSKPHYDLTNGKRWQALNAGAVPLEQSSEILAFFDRWKHQRHS